MDDRNRDRISELPDALIHHIFSYMDMNDVIRTSILSNRWKTLWSSNPSLNFSFHICPVCKNSNFPRHCYSCKKTINGFMDFVNRVLILRKNSDLDKFNLSCIFGNLDTARLHTWVLAAIDKNARNLLLEVCCGSQPPIVLPYNLFTSTITVLKLSFYCNSKYRPTLPISISIAPNIKDLQLKSVLFPDGEGELSLSCPVLENLSITQCDLSNINVFTISTLQLESLEFVYLYTKVDISCQVKTCTPNLKRIKVKAYSTSDNSMLDYSLENLTSLVNAEVGFNSYYSSKKSCSKCLIKLLNGIHNVQSLKLTKCSLQLLTDVPESLEKLSDMFGNLKNLMLKLDSPCVHATLKFLDKFSHIENIVWERRPTVEKLPMVKEKWVANLRFEKIFNCLKTFEIRNFQGFKIELKFLELLLQRAVALEEMIINTSQPCLLVEKLQSLSRASSNASIWFKQSCQANTLEDMHRSFD